LKKGEAKEKAIYGWTLVRNIVYTSRLNVLKQYKLVILI